jgi:hypothetical protein
VNYGAVLLTLIRLVPGSVLAANGALTTRQLGGRKRAFRQQEVVVKIKTESLVKIREFPRNRPRVGLSINAGAFGEPLFVATHILS